MSAFADAPSVEAAPVTEREVRSLCEEYGPKSDECLAVRELAAHEAAKGGRRSYDNRRPLGAVPQQVPQQPRGVNWLLIQQGLQLLSPPPRTVPTTRCSSFGGQRTCTTQ
jgi:hypothetical protein